MKLNKKEFTKLQSAFSVVEGMDKQLGLSEEDIQKANKYLNTRATVRDIFKIADFVTYPILEQVKTNKNEISLMEIILNKLGVSEEDWDKASDKLKEDSEKQLEELQKAIKKAVEHK